MIPESLIDNIKDIDIVEVINKYVQLKKSGSNFIGLCPFHDEKTPSFMVSRGKGIYKCFGCGEGGDTISFIQKIETISFREAIQLLCETNNIHYDFEQNIPDDRQLKLDKDRIIMKMANDFFKSKFKTSKSEKYSMEIRGYTNEVINDFGLSHAPMGLTNLLEHMENKGISKSDLENNALIKKHNDSDSYYDCFRSRLMFPICDKFGRVIAFSGRALNKGQKPKYYNSAETDLFKKSHTLYALHLAKGHIARHDNCIVVEGATDVIAMHIKGIKNTVATLGTSFTPEHAMLIKSYSKNVTLLFDGDDAGLKAVFRSCQILFKKGVFAKVCQLPQGADPDTFFKDKDDKQVRSYLKDNSKDFILFRFSLLSNSVIDKVRVSKELLETINEFPDRNAREIMKVQYMEQLGLSYYPLKAPTKNKQVHHNKNPEINLLRVAIMIDHSSVYQRFKWLPDLHTYFQDTKLKKLAKEVLTNSKFDIHHALYHADKDISESTTEILNSKAVYSNPEWDTEYHILKFERYVMDCIEKQIFTGQRAEDEITQRNMLAKISENKKKIDKEMLQLETERRKIRNPFG